jgi:hypothetical protein
MASERLENLAMVARRDPLLPCWRLVGARGFEPPTSCSRSRRAQPGCATPRLDAVEKTLRRLPPIAAVASDALILAAMNDSLPDPRWRGYSRAGGELKDTVTPHGTS